MSGSVAVLVRTFRVGRYECTLTFPQAALGQVVAMSAEWAPELPERLTPDEIAAYRAGRHAVLEELAALIGGNVGVIE